MMNIVFDNSFPDLPEIWIDPENGIIGLSGMSLPVEAWEGYQELCDRIKHLIQKGVKTIQFNFKIDYLNTYTSKELLKVFDVLGDAYQNLKLEVKVNWYYVSDDEDMLEMGQEYSKLIDLPFEFIYKS